jgi:hypothetical protein
VFGDIFAKLLSAAFELNNIHDTNQKYGFMLINIAKCQINRKS